MRKTFHFLLLSFCIPVYCPAQNSTKQELTKTDIIAAGKLDGKDISVYGFYLGMKKEEAKRILQYNTNKITVDYNSWNIVSYPFSDSAENTNYVFDVDSITSQKKNCILFLGWNNGDPGLARITVFSEFKDHAIALTRQLFSPDVVNPASAFYKKWLIKPISGSPGISFSSWFYPARNILIIENKATGEPKYYFMLTKKPV